MMKTLELSTVDQMNCFPDMQSVKYNVLDKVEQITQGRYRVNFEYGYDNQRMSMTKVDNIANATYTKDYVGNCEFIDNNGNDEVRTYLAGPAGVFAVVVQKGNTTNIDYVYKDNLGSWTTIADSTKRVVERMSYDAWGNLRDATTWCGNFGRLPKYERGFTGHEHLYEFGLINMNGRMYDPMSASFLSPDSYIQDPTTQQGFNRYAYCAYNPLKYVDPSGELYFGWVNIEYMIEQEIKHKCREDQYRLYEIVTSTHELTMFMAGTLFSQGMDDFGNGSGNHGSPAGGSGDNQNGPTGNGHGDGNPTNNTTNSNGRPGESPDNPTTADYLFIKCYLHFQIGGGNPLYVDAQSLGLENYSIYEDFVHYINDDGKETYSINLISNPYMFDNPQVAMALGQIVLTPKGDNMYEIHFDTYDFNFQPDSDRWDNGFFNWRNTGTFYGGLIHGTIFNTTYHMTPMFFGGPFDIKFVNNPIYIPYYP